MKVSLDCFLTYANNRGRVSTHSKKAKWQKNVISRNEKRFGVTLCVKGEDGERKERQGAWTEDYSISRERRGWERWILRDVEGLPVQYRVSKLFTGQSFSKPKEKIRKAFRKLLVWKCQQVRSERHHWKRRKQVVPLIKCFTDCSRCSDGALDKTRSALQVFRGFIELLGCSETRNGIHVALSMDFISRFRSSS